MKLEDIVFSPKPAKINPRVGLFSAAALYSKVRHVVFLHLHLPTPLLK